MYNRTKPFLPNIVVNWESSMGGTIFSYTLPLIFFDTITMEKENKTFKQFMLDLTPEVRTWVFQQIVKQCHVTPACVRMWEREDSSPQDWRIRVINLIAKHYGAKVIFPPINRRKHLEGHHTEGGAQ